MTGERVIQPASTRPRYGFDVANGEDNGGNPFRKAAMLALLAVASGLVLVIPESEDGFELATDEPGVVADPAPAAASAGSLPSAVADDDELAIGAAETSAAVAGSGATPSPEPDGGLGFSMVEKMRAAQAAASLLVPEAESTTTSTTAVPTTAAPTTAAPTTAAPTTAAVSTTASSSTEQAEDTSTSTSVDEGQADQNTGSTETTVADGGEESVDQSSTETTAETAADATDTTDTTETTVEETTTTTAQVADGTEDWVDAGHGVMVPPVLLKIRFCESTDNYQAANRYSTARGAYQFLTGSWDWYGHKDRYGVSQAHLATNAQQDEAALLTWQQDGTRPWNASRHCWG